MEYLGYAISIIGALATGLVGVIVWSVRQEGRINAHDKLFEAQKEVTILRQTITDERHNDLKDRLVRIERKLDAQNNSHVTP